MSEHVLGEHAGIIGTPNDSSIGVPIPLARWQAPSNNLGVPINPIAPDYGKRIAEARERRKMTQGQLAKAAGVSQPSLSAIENGDTKPDQVKLDTVWKITSALGLPMTLITAETPMDYNVEPAPVPRSRVPLLSLVSAGLPTESVVGAVLDYVDFDSQASQLAFALQVKGESMVRPDGTGFPHGCYILVEPKRKAKSENFVIARFADQDEATFKQLILDGQAKLLKPLNPAYPIHILGPQGHIAGTVIEKRIIERY